MVAETLTAARATEPQPFKAHGSGNLCAAYGTYAVAANVEAGDIFEMCRLPAGATVIGGWVVADNMDTNATETLDMDLGWAANGTEALDADGLGNFGLWKGDAQAELKPETFVYKPIGGTFKDGPITFTNATTIQFTANAAAATFVAGDLSVYILYVVG